MTEPRPILTFLYLYLGMGLIFVIGMIYGWKQGDVGFKTGRQRKNFGIMVGGYLLYGFVHGFLQFFASRW